MLPRGDYLDKMVVVLSFPAILNFMLVPLVGAADTFWVGKMGNAAALAGQGAANQVFSTTFWVLGFLPSVITPLVASAYGKGDMEGVRKHIAEALFLATFIGTIGMTLVVLIPQILVSVVIPSGAPAMEYAVPYILARGASFVPAMLTTVGFATFRGTLDTFTPLMVSAFSNLFHIALLPIFVLKLGFGVVGAGLATCISDVVSCSVYLTILLRKKFIESSSLFRVPTLAAISELMSAGFSVQLRTLAMNSVFIVGSGRIQAMDLTGTSAAAHTIATQLWSIGGVILLAMSTVAAILVPKAMATASIDGDLVSARHTANRMLIWGLIVGCILAAVQLSMIPLLNVFTPLEEVREAARVPFTISAAMQIMNGVVFVGEGVMQGHRAFRQLAVNTVLAMIVLQLTIPILGTSLPGVWCSYFVFNVGRLIGVLYHHFYQVGPHKVCCSLCPLFLFPFICSSVTSVPVSLLLFLCCLRLKCFPRARWR
ncbi:hypothetical protein GUITHDRAFT_72907 [Guillardia theta CCMP2712]|uniref:Uncharacterized protein n=1 Tax=Guillardia theta (strain CCMP2712) TaxID=905079 RepID=L1J4Z8_GUITC|nr:hypothetical protein GUITHDRAFT_72907 [Guillardia theta CCMP2712]EKX43586.1 hypothetical protein GUITHDRAFT_72907 [Guillardia theta CCMP2712]|eukprot:XP_005830566.1 hypothetical protein GUITHDRAFT_72907 [Guillardia theta CCMP2712]